MVRLQSLKQKQTAIKVLTVSSEETSRLEFAAMEHGKFPRLGYSTAERVHLQVIGGQVLLTSSQRLLAVAFFPWDGPLHRCHIT